MLPSFSSQPLTTGNLPEMARKIISLDPACRVFLFYGPLGAGKTTLIKEICRQLGSNDNFSSPSFSLVNEYQGENEMIYHMDLYRVNKTEELFDLGIEEYFSSGAYCLIEWPQLAEDLIDMNHIRITISFENELRKVSAEKIIPDTF